MSCWKNKQGEKPISDQRVSIAHGDLQTSAPTHLTEQPQTRQAETGLCFFGERSGLTAESSLRTGLCQPHHSWHKFVLPNTPPLRPERAAGSFPRGGCQQVTAVAEGGRLLWRPGSAHRAAPAQEAPADGSTFSPPCGCWVSPPSRKGQTLGQGLPAAWFSTERTAQTPVDFS